MDDARCCDGKAVYEIRIRGVLDEQWSDGLAGLIITPQADGSALLVGPLRDQAALQGLLNRIRDMGLPQLSVERKSTCP